MARRRLGIALRKRRKLITFWLLAGLLALSYRANSFCAELGEERCDAFVSDLAGALNVIVLLGFALGIVYFSVRTIRRRREYAIAGFKNEPWKYHRHIIRVYGRVEGILPDSLGEKIVRHMRNIVRTMTKNPNTVGRYIHQRFLIRSSQLRHGENILVLHNVSFGRVAIRVGDWVEIKGEYLHSPGMRRGILGPIKTYYGKLHYTHQPKGYLYRLKRKPDRLHMQEVVVFESENRREEQRKIAS